MIKALREFKEKVFILNKGRWVTFSDIRKNKEFAKRSYILIEDDVSLNGLVM